MPERPRPDRFDGIGSRLLRAALVIYDVAAVSSDEDIDRYLRPIVGVPVVWLNQRMGAVGRAREVRGVMAVAPNF